MVDELQESAATSYEFTRFRLLPGRRQLFADGRPVDIGDRAIDLLAVLLRAGGEVVSKERLLETVWMGRVVEENALQAQVSALRRALGADRELIKTVSGRGYQFTGEFVTSKPESSRRQTNLAERIFDLVGRDVQVTEALELLSLNRLVTLIGTGGIGKTQLALEVGRHAVSMFEDGVWVAQLGLLSNSDLLPAAVSSAVGLPHLGEAVPLARALRTKNMLIVLDGCEHVITAAASLADRLLHSGANLRVLATSREPLRSDGECIYQVPPLSSPPVSRPDVGDPMLWGAVNLFVTRARESAPHFQLSAEVAEEVAHICRQLDGIPLALELAASRTAVLGVHEVSARLEDRLTLLTTGKRTALPRHQTLQATLDWSYDLLEPHEQIVFRRIAVFNGEFSLESAAAVVSSGDHLGASVVTVLADLVAKSLVSRGSPALHGGHRLLKTTRAYALSKLRSSSEQRVFSRRHAEHYARIFEQADAEWSEAPPQAWLTKYTPCLDNVRAALDWAFSPEGEALTGISLTVAALPLWFQLSLVDECLRRVESALDAYRVLTTRREHQHMMLLSALGWSLMYTSGRARETGEAWSDALVIAERLGDTDYRLRSLWGLWAGNMNNGRFRRALNLAERFCATAKHSSEAADQFVGERMQGAALHFIGDQTAARGAIEHMQANYVAPARRSHIVRFQFDQGITARITLARVLWLQGFPDKSLSLVAATITDALALDHALSIGNALAQAACPIALYSGDLEVAEHYIEMLVAHTQGGALDVWNSYSRCFMGMLLIGQSDADRGIPLLQTAIDELRGARFSQYRTAFLAALSDALLRTGRAREGLATIEEALQECKRSEEGWCLPELHRLRGDLQRIQGVASSAVQNEYELSIALARRQGALSWELRTVTSFARMRIAEGRDVEARAALAAVRDRFTEGFGTADLKSASALLTG